MRRSLVMMHEAIADDSAAVAFELAPSVDAAFAAFFDASRRPMMRLAFLLTGSGAQAEEAVQESFVRVFERWSSIDDPAAYMHRTVVNRCTSWHRHRAVVRRTESQVATDEAYVDRPDEITDALAQLPARRRAVVILRFYERLELSEIAEVLGISTGTVKSTLHRALTQMKGILG